MNALVYGGSGALGSAIAARLKNDGFDVITPPHQQGAECISALPPLAAVVWAQGLNATDSILDFDPQAFASVMEANVGFVAHTLGRLVACDRLSNPSRLCIISSIWQEQARSEKFSYTVSKAAVAGLVRAAAADLGRRGILVNAVLPGVVDTPMSRAHLTQEQIAAICDASPLGRLPAPEDVASAVAFLVGTDNRAITGQSLTVDAGFTPVRRL